MSQPYLSLEAQLHDAFWDSEDDATESRLMADFLAIHPGTALEMGCGSGRLMLPLLKQGFHVEGLELSTDMHSLAQQRADASNLQPKFHLGDMSSWQSDIAYSAILAPAFTLQLASDPAQTLRHWHSLLKPHGGLYLTVFIPYAELLGDLPENEWYPDHQVTLPDGRVGTLETRHQLDKTSQRVERRHRYSLTGEPPLIHESTQSIRWFMHHELVDLLASSGFRTDLFFLDFDPNYQVEFPEDENFDGILTYHASKL